MEQSSHQLAVVKVGGSASSLLSTAAPCQAGSPRSPRSTLNFVSQLTESLVSELKRLDNTLRSTIQRDQENFANWLTSNSIGLGCDGLLAWGVKSYPLKITGRRRSKRSKHWESNVELIRCKGHQVVPLSTPLAVTDTSSRHICPPKPGERSSNNDRLPSHASAQSSGLHDLEYLPVWDIEGGRKRRYAWDGRQLKVVNVDDEFLSESKQGAWLQRHYRELQRLLHRAFLPDHVKPEYWTYMRWKCLQRMVSTIAHTNSTQSLLRAVGIGRRASVPSAAALNWVLKDGLGRLGKLTMATGFGRAFDADLKRLRFITSAMFTASLGIEMLTPFLPRYFLPMATAANIGKSIGLTAYLATTPSIHKSFALTENLADISAKGQAQTVIADNLGLAIAVGIGAACRGNEKLRWTLPLMMFPVLGALDLLAISKELRSVHLNSLNKERTEIIVERWIRTGRVPSLQEVSEAEGLIRPAPIGNGELPLAISSLREAAASPRDVLSLLSAAGSERYLLALRPQRRPGTLLAHALGKNTPGKKKLVLSIREDAKASDILKGLLQAAYVRSLTMKDSQSSSFQKVPSEHNSTLDLALEDQALTESRSLAEENLVTLLEQMEQMGWVTKQVILSSTERAVYHVEEATT